MKKWMLLLIPGLFASAVALTACESEGPAEQAAEDVGEQIDETTEAAGEQLEQTQEALSEVPEEAGDAVERAGDRAESETDR